ncbi:formylglycine-generating enzyme family protein [Microcoleus vaginatus]|uniref:formylglycine-generating enzyme family protein n=1 Tax=Microcoleus vaginatus TaxID=119532 RepID=UPI001688FF98|nr:formylglycine-generating enzyme family protein [Microcoleus sp. FACHB-84]MBD2009864.1 formylglycine-generating enzyme family protein [Microcoleus sp. FACHB-45]
MTENPNQPREYDAVLGGESQVPMAAAVLGGIPGVKSRLASPIVEVKIAALSEALKYGDAGLDLIIGALQDESIAVKFAAYSLLKDRDEPNLKQQFQKYLPTFEFDVITVNAQGKENSRRRHYAHFFPEDLGNGSVLEMVYIPGGTFMMGSPATYKYRRDNESPQHQVTVPAFFASKYAITRAQWQALMGNNPSWLKFEKRPVEVSWDEVVEFCDRLSQQTGKKYRLLSEAEWEYACRAGTTTPFYFGETITRQLVNCHPYPEDPRDGPLPWSLPIDVGNFPPNAFGLYDMHGNVWEWCSDRCHENYNGAPTDGSSWETTNNYRVMRGGSWHNEPAICRSDFRCLIPDGHRGYGGFRVAVSSSS